MYFKNGSLQTKIYKKVDIFQKRRVFARRFFMKSNRS